MWRSTHQLLIIVFRELIFALQFRILNDPLRRCEQILDLGNVAHEEGEPDNDVDHRLERECQQLSWVYSFLWHRKDDHGKVEDNANLIEPNAHPPVDSIKAERDVRTFLDVVDE